VSVVIQVKKNFAVKNLTLVASLDAGTSIIAKREGRSALASNTTE